MRNNVFIASFDVITAYHAIATEFNRLLILI